MYQLLNFDWFLPIIQLAFFAIFQIGIYMKYGEKLKQFDMQAIAKFALLSIFCALVLLPVEQTLFIIGLEIVFITVYHFGIWIKFWAKKDYELSQNPGNTVTVSLLFYNINVRRWGLLLYALRLSVLSVVAIQPIAPQTITMVILIDSIPILGTIAYRMFLGPLFPKFTA